uniref:Uncharacterized protein n=1 Tax=Stegastes partitus TaxID=144197 RepID=A0A3B4Z905_9TELE
MAQLQAKHGESNSQQGEEAKQRETEMRNSILTQVPEQSARARLEVKPEKANAVENYCVQMARFGFRKKIQDFTAELHAVFKQSRETEKTKKNLLDQ